MRNTTTTEGITLIGVMTCGTNPQHDLPMPERTQVDHTLRIPAIRETWATPDTKFFTGAELNCGDSYYETAFKVRAMCQWALDYGYKGLFKVDDDTYVRPERLFAASFDAYDFVCRVLPPTDENHPVPYPYGGCGYYLGERMLDAAANDKQCVSDPEGDIWGRCNTYEDGWIGRVARDANITLTDDHRLKALRLSIGDTDGWPRPWREESPMKTNDTIAVCEFPGELMYAVHNHFLKSYE